MNPPAATPPDTIVTRWGRVLLLLRLLWLFAAGFSIVHFVATLPTAYEQVQMVCVDAACADDMARLSPTQATVLHEWGFSLEAYARYAVVLASLSALVWWISKARCKSPLKTGWNGSSSSKTAYAT